MKRLLLGIVALVPILSAQAQQVLEARAQLMPAQEAVLAANLEAVLEALPVAEGEAFKVGQPLVRFDCAERQAHLAYRQAELKAAEAVLQTQQQLAELQAVSSLELAQAEAEQAKAEASLELEQVLTSRCVLRAPFQGRVVEHRVNAHEFVTQGTPLLSVVSSAPLTVEVLVPSLWLSFLHVGSPLLLRVDETGSSHPARITRLGARVDAVSQTVPIQAELERPDATLLPGMSGIAQFTGGTADE